MALRLKIENMATLPDGGPVQIEIDRRGIDIGRDSYLDWTLPDPERFISGKHCEIRFRDGAYWLHDTSTNGTSVNSEHGRMTGPHRLATGDRIHIGRYIVAVELTGADAAAAGTGAGATGSAAADPWGGIEDAAPGIDRRDMAPRAAARPGRPGDDLADASFDWSVGRIAPAAPPGTLDWDTGPAAGQSPVLPPAGASPVLPPAAPERSPVAPTPPPASAAASMPPPAADLWSAPPVAGGWEEPAAPMPAGMAPFVPAAPTEARPEVRPGERPEAPAEAPAAVVPMPRPRATLASQWSDAPADPARAPAAAPAPPAAPAAEPTLGDWVAAFERGAGLPPGAVSRRDAAFAEELGALMRLVARHLQTLLLARAETKGAIRSGNRTMIQAMENNPLKFSPAPEDALRIMFGEKVTSYLDARATIEASFRDLQAHQVQTFAAMQKALQAMVEDLDPDRIAQTTPGDGGLAALVSSRRAKLWDIYVERFRARAGRHERGMLDAFMILFAELYDAEGRR